VEELAWAGDLEPPACDLLVNCTPVGMGAGPAAEALPAVRLEALASATIVCDLNPDVESSAFVRAARARGHLALGGLPMLARQGAAAFEAWTGRPAPLGTRVAALERAVGSAGG
jgi:shikimate dehydrogenase